MNPRTKKRGLLALVAVATVLLGSYVVLFTGPYRFTERDLREAFIAHLREGVARGEPWDSPTMAAVEYIQSFAGHPSDRSKPSALRITSSQRSATEVTVTVFDRVEDDSIDLVCHRLTMRLDRGVWIPVRHQVAWQGRGRIGWTIKPTA
jgi:hypothetical protein